MSKAAGNPPKLEFLANFAEKSGNLPMAAEAYRSMVKFPAAAVPGYLGLIRIAEKRADMRQLRDVIGELSRQLPEDPAPKNDLAYLNLLFNERIDDSLQISRDLVSALPDRLPTVPPWPSLPAKKRIPKGARRLRRDKDRLVSRSPWLAGGPGRGACRQRTGRRGPPAGRLHQLGSVETPGKGFGPNPARTP